MPRTQLQRINDKDRHTPDRLEVAMIACARRLLPPPYQLGIAQVNASLLVTCQPPFNQAPLRRPFEVRALAGSIAARKALAQAFAWARRDLAITKRAEAMCQKLGLHPMHLGPCPFGPTVLGPILGAGGFGYSQTLQAPPEQRRMLDWLWEPAAILMAFDDTKGVAHAQ